MKTTKLFLSVCLLAFSHFATAQEYAVDKGATIISGTIGFTSQGGDLYENDGKRLSTFILTPSFSSFVASNFFLGGSLAFTHLSQSGESLTSIAIGPHLGVMGGDANSTAFPYLSAGLSYYSESYGSFDLSGTELMFSVGVITALKPHLGMTFEASYNVLSIKPNGSSHSVSGNTFSLGIGISGLLYRGTATNKKTDKAPSTKP